MKLNRPIIRFDLRLFLCASIVLVALTGWLYWPGLQGPSLLDDGVNLGSLESLDDNPHYWWDVVRGNGSGLLGRGISMASFVLERNLADTSLYMMKRTNVLLHLLGGCIVIALALKLLSRAGIRKPLWYALLVGSLWLLTPFFVSTVLYVVQRMAQLSTIFVLAGLYCYVLGREQLQKDWKGWFILASVPIFGLLATFSKENGVLLIPLIFMLEICFFRFQAYSHQARWLLKSGYIVVLLGPLLFFAAYSLITPDSSLLNYVHREFSLVERLLTQARILWEYIFHLVWPSLEGLGVYHDDYLISTGFFHPYTTLFALVAWGLVAFIISWCLVKQRYLMVCFGLGFYLIGHLLESTVIPLELYFEHRNYLPAFGLYWLIAWGVARLAQSFPASQPALAFVALIYVLCFAVQSGIQVSIWSNSYVLAANSFKDHPNSNRANASLASLTAEAGDIAGALVYSKNIRDIRRQPIARDTLRDMALYCMSNNNPEEQLFSELVQRQDSLRDASANENLQITINQILEDECPNFDKKRLGNILGEMFLGTERMPGTPKIYALLAKLENKLGRYERASRYVSFWLERDPEAVKALLMLLYFSSAQENEQQKSLVLEKLNRLDALGKLSRQERDNYRLFE